MSKHFQLLDFLRRAPKTLLQTYCARQGILEGFDWGTGKSVPVEQAAKALRALGPNVSQSAVALFNELWEQAGPGFTKGLLNEAKFHYDEDAYGIIQRHQSHLAKAFWATLERPQYRQNAKILSNVDKLPAGAWIKRGGMPPRPTPVDQSHVFALEEKLIEFFTTREHKGANCKIDCLRRGDEEIFFAYSEDHPDTDLSWRDGKLLQQILNPSFNLIFKHNNERRTLEIYIEGDRRLVPDLQDIFSQSIMGVAAPPERLLNKRMFDINRLVQPGFQFQFSDDLDISDARVSQLRFVRQGEPWGRFTVEADNTRVRDALATFVADLTAKLPMSRVKLDQVCVKVTFNKREGDRKMLTRDCYITMPNSRRIKMDELGERIAAMLIQSGIERTEPADEGAA